MFPAAPNVEGLPLGLQVVATIGFLLVSIWAVWTGYRKRLDREPPGAATTVLASIPDMSAVRQLTDQCRELCHKLDSLERAWLDHTHFLRNKIEIDQEVAQRLRELKEEIARSDRQRFHGG